MLAMLVAAAATLGNAGRRESVRGQIKAKHRSDTGQILFKSRSCIGQMLVQHLVAQPPRGWRWESISLSPLTRCLHLTPSSPLPPPSSCHTHPSRPLLPLPPVLPSCGHAFNGKTRCARARACVCACARARACVRNLDLEASKGSTPATRWKRVAERDQRSDAYDTWSKLLVKYWSKLLVNPGRTLLVK